MYFFQWKKKSKSASLWALISNSAWKINDLFVCLCNHPIRKTPSEKNLLYFDSCVPQPISVHLVLQKLDGHVLYTQNKGTTRWAGRVFFPPPEMEWSSKIKISWNNPITTCLMQSGNKMKSVTLPNFENQIASGTWIIFACELW